MLLAIPVWYTSACNTSEIYSCFLVMFCVLVEKDYCNYVITLHTSAGNLNSLDLWSRANLWTKELLPKYEHLELLFVFCLKMLNSQLFFIDL